MADSKQAPLDAAAAAKAAFASVQDKPFPNDIFTAPELRWAVIGCGVIANQMAQSLALAGRKLTGVANRTLTKAQTFADQYGVEKVYDTVEDLYADPDIDAVYITTRTTPISPICAPPWRPASTFSARRPSRSTPPSSMRPAPLPPNATWSLWTLPRCSTCPCIKSCAAAWMPASLAA